MRRVSIFGATGSVGQNCIDLIDRNPASYDVVALTGGRNVARLAQDARRLNADIAVTAFDECLPDLRVALEGTQIEAAAGTTALAEAATPHRAAYRKSVRTLVGPGMPIRTGTVIPRARNSPNQSSTRFASNENWVTTWVCRPRASSAAILASMASHRILSGTSGWSSG